MDVREAVSDSAIRLCELLSNSEFFSVYIIRLDVAGRVIKVNWIMLANKKTHFLHSND